MPRSTDYLLAGHTYHITQRCHNRSPLLRFARDRNVYREWLREGVRRHRVPVYAYCITSNHIHIVLHADTTEAVANLMHLAAGSTAKQYNVRKSRLGSLWERPYHCTLIEGGRHLLNCLCYVELNMVRAGVVPHPQDWRWCSYDELIGRRQRYRIVNMGRLLDRLDIRDASEFRTWYTDAINDRLASGNLEREAYWTESLAVGSRDFVEAARTSYSHRYSVDLSEASGGTTGTWTIRENRVPYGAV